MSAAESSEVQPKPQITIFLDKKDYTYCPGEALTGVYRILDVEADQIQSVEMSVLWRTEGKGDEDMGVIDFRALSRRQEDWINPRIPGKIDTVLPLAPVSYEGQSLKIRWCVRVRMYLTDGAEVLAERGFLVQ